MIRPGKALKMVLEYIFKKPATINYPHDKAAMPPKFRGKLSFDASKCVGCKMCMKDCPSGAITIKKVGEKSFQAEMDLAKCIYCAQCVDSCFKKALSISQEFELAQIDRKKLVVLLDNSNAESDKK